VRSDDFQESLLRIFLNRLISPQIGMIINNDVVKFCVELVSKFPWEESLAMEALAFAFVMELPNYLPGGQMGTAATFDTND
jgi:hypothetical protein